MAGGARKGAPVTVLCSVCEVSGSSPGFGVTGGSASITRPPRHFVINEGHLYLRCSLVVESSFFGCTECGAIEFVHFRIV